MRERDPRPSGTIERGISQGINIVENRKHAAIDPDKHSPKDLARLTNPSGYGSKWLKGISDEAKRELIWHALERKGVRI